MNNIRYKKSYLAIIVIIITASCKKKDRDPEPLLLQGQYETGSTISVAPAVMLTTNGIIHDQAFIQAYLTRTQHMNGFVFGNTTAPADHIRWGVDFKANNQATVTAYPTSGPSISKQYEITDNTGSSFVLGSLDSLSFMKPAYTSICDQYSRQLVMAHFQPACTPLPPGSEVKELCKERMAIPVNVISGELYIALLTHDITSRSESASCWRQSRFQVAVVNNSLSVAPGDTIIYQPTRIKLIRK
ncbi:hypothetical protein [Chitinophaga nivalis]|uniref:Lipoprotein n=1 Tax=Chitinophaga nivalis TaxID=2991709 RepID=A0ABT3IKF9_9BACT|nr:hypothetical protein [Chitinophaga nivalis]MCW3465854.1 hypothetical protein [Chitinophaga nivalis]MCW3484455.1 hypothetical protein [Chitinophaga nivalis]